MSAIIARKRRTFQFRGFTSLVMAVAFAISAVAGLVLYVTPQGRVANWSGWSLAGLGKEQWSALHMNSGLLFLAASLFHLIYNWRPLLHYLRSKATARPRLRLEAVGAGLIGLVLVAGTLAEVPPFSTVVHVNDCIKAHWERTSAAAPLPHAEELTLRRFAAVMELSEDELAERLAAAGFSGWTAETKVGDLAQAAGVPPSAIYAVAQREPGSGGQGGKHGQGLGRLTIAELCRRHGAELGTGLAELERRGLTVGPDDTVRAVADRLGVTPMDLAAVLCGR